ncbi:MAG: sulfite exporter TauE/SafE family protein [Pseudomonadota bacterium]
MDWSAENLLIVTAVFFLGGIVKGVIGTGLPTVAIALLAALFGVKTAILLLAAPAIVTNIWQAFSGGAFVKLTLRLAPFLAAIFIGVLVGYAIASNAADHALIAVLGTILFVYSVASLMKVRMPSPGRREPVASAGVGLINGTITGMTGTFIVPSVIYLQVLGFGKRELIQAMGITFLFSITVLTITLGVERQIPGAIAAISAFAVLPALAGQAAGQAIRNRMNEDTFRRVFLIGLAGIGVYLIVRAVVGV